MATILVVVWLFLTGLLEPGRGATVLPTPAPTHTKASLLSSTPKLTAKPLSAADTPAPTATTEVLIPSISGSGEVSMGFTEEGSPYRGNPDATVTLLEYSDFQ